MGRRYASNFQTTMIALSKFKEALGSITRDMTEEQVLKLRENQDRMAEIIFDDWLFKVSKSKLQLQIC